MRLAGPLSGYDLAVLDEGFGTKVGQKGCTETAPLWRVRSASLTGLSRAFQALRNLQNSGGAHSAKTLAKLPTRKHLSLASLFSGDPAQCGSGHRLRLDRWGEPHDRTERLGRRGFRQIQ